MVIADIYHRLMVVDMNFMFRKYTYSLEHSYGKYAASDCSILVIRLVSGIQ